ncbi:MAG: PGF-pre-PGF domain-containing protein [Candidatus Woesearchaeota archaeon]
MINFKNFQKTIILFFSFIFLLCLNSFFSFGFNNVTLDIFDSTINETIISNQQAYFYANYTNNSLKINNSNCNISFNDLYDEMVYNDTLNLFVYNRSFITLGNYSYNISCNSTINSSFTNETDIIQILIDETPPKKDSVGTDNVTNDSITFLISVDKIANSTLYYGTNENNLSYNLEKNDFKKNHVYLLENLSNNTRYYFNITLCNTDNVCEEYGSYSEKTDQNLDLTPSIITFNSPSFNNNTLFNEWNNILLSLNTDYESNCVVTSHKISNSVVNTNYEMVSSNNLLHEKNFTAQKDSTNEDDFFFEIECTKIENSITSSKKVFFKVNDTVSPTISFTSDTIKNNAKTNIQIQEIFVKVDEEMYQGFPKIKINSGTENSMSLDDASSLIYKFTTSELSEGEYNISIVAKDKKGNTREIKRVFFVDLTPPRMFVNMPLDDSQIDDCTDLVINISLDDEGQCDFELEYVLEDRFNRCTNRCTNYYERCDDRADSSAERTECRDEEEECKDECDLNKYSRLLSGNIQDSDSRDKCYDGCDEQEIQCNDNCRDEWDECILDASNADERENCYDDSDLCSDNCELDNEFCIFDCNYEEFTLINDFDRCFDDGDYRLMLNCFDDAENEVFENITFSLKDITPPTIVNSFPNGTIKTRNIDLVVNTNKDSNCKLSKTAKNFNELDYKFIASQKKHTFQLENLENKNYTYYVLCQDEKNNTMTDHYEINFNVNSSIELNNEEKEKKEKKEDDNTLYFPFAQINKNEENEIEIDKNISINKIILKTNKNKSNIGLILVKEDSSSITIKPKENSYEFFSLVKENFTNSELENIRLEFKVEKSWINNNNIDVNTITLQKYQNQWNKVNTKKLKDETNHIYFVSELSELSSFAITGEKIETKDNLDSELNDSEDKKLNDSKITEDLPTEVVDEEDKTNYFWFIILILCVVVVGGGTTAFFVFKAGKHPQHDPNAVLPKQHTHSREATDNVASLSSQSLATNVNESQFDNIKYDENDELAKYIVNSKKYGLSNEEIIKSLVNAGHDENNVKNKFVSLKIEQDDGLNEYILFGLNQNYSLEEIKQTLLLNGYLEDEIDQKLLELDVDKKNVNKSGNINNTNNNRNDINNKNVNGNENEDNSVDNSFETQEKTTKKDFKNNDFKTQTTDGLDAEYKNNLINYIKAQLDQGNSIENIKKILIDNNNSFELIDEIIKTNFKNYFLNNNNNNDDNNGNNNLGSTKISDELRKYIENCLKENMSKYHIKALLKKGNYSKEEIKTVLGELDNIKKNMK